MISMMSKNIVAHHLPLFLFREEYGKLFDFVNAKKLSIKNRGFKEVCVCSFLIFDHKGRYINTSIDSTHTHSALCVCAVRLYCVHVEEGWY